MSERIRPVARVIAPEPVVEGAGVHLRRSIGTRGLDNLDPFLLLDHFESTAPAEYEAGFPVHPHRGIETVTLMRTGEVRHADSLGHRGSIGPGDIQWMTSGSGILHEEMPQVRPEGIAGLQLWLNLPAAEKMSRPKYRDLVADRLPVVEADGGARIRVIAGEAGGGRLRGPVEGLAVAPLFVDITLPARRDASRGGHGRAHRLRVRGRPARCASGAQAVRGPALVVFGDGDAVEATAGPHGRSLPPRRGPAPPRAHRPLGPVRHEHARRDRADAPGAAQWQLHQEGAPRRLNGR